MVVTEHSSDKQIDLSLCTSKQANKKAIVLVGPTASGKSGLALQLAKQLNGVIINADSMQVYEDVPVLTARPSQNDLNEAEHRLYGFLKAGENCSAVKWAELAAAEMRRIWDEKKTPVLVGGTGLYIQTLQNGISPLPDVSVNIRNKIRERFKEIGHDAFLHEVREKDKTFRFSDPQRLIRAAEIMEATGKALSYWQAQPFQKLIEADWFGIFIDLPRDILYQRCNARFEQMIKGPAIEEVRELLIKNPPADSLILKAIGVQEIKSYLEGKQTKEAAVEKACQMTRHYAKRQVTWFKHRFLPDAVLLNADFEEILTKALHFMT